MFKHLPGPGPRLTPLPQRRAWKDSNLFLFLADGTDEADFADKTVFNPRNLKNLRNLRETLPKRGTNLNV